MRRAVRRAPVGLGLLLLVLAGCGGDRESPDGTILSPRAAPPEAANIAGTAAEVEAAAPPPRPAADEGQEASAGGDGEEAEAGAAEGGKEFDPRREFLIELRDERDVAVVRRIGETVAARRGLALHVEAPVFLIHREDLRAFVLSEMDAEDEAESEFDEELLSLLGIIGPDVALTELFLDLFVGLALGFYDFDLGGIVVISANDHVAAEDVRTLTHEYVHALQDQHFRLGDYFDAHEDNGDRLLAARFVAEGDAQLNGALFRDLEAELRVQLEPRRDRLPRLDGGVPWLLQLIFTAPYSHGVSAVQEVLNEGGYAALDALLDDLPPSTEQLLHAEKLAAREAPLTVEAPDVWGALGADWEFLGTDTVGEFQLRTALVGQVQGAAASAAAAGWGGDRLRLYRSPEGAGLLAWRLEWDDAAEAAEFFDTLVEWIDGRTAAGAERAAGGSAALALGDSLSAWGRVEGTTTWVVVGEDARAVERAAAALGGV